MDDRVKLIMDGESWTVLDSESRTVRSVVSELNRELEIVDD